jgi:hypothetical protein
MGPVKHPPLTGPNITNITTGGWWDADLGVPLFVGDSTWILLGDVESLVSIPRTPNAMGQLQGLSAGDAGALSELRVQWQETPNGLAAPFFRLLGESTVPAGAIALPAPS